MTREQARKRLKFVEGRPLVQKARPVNVQRRGENHIEIEMKDTIEHDDFFDFEKELAEMQSAREQSARAASSESFFSEEDDAEKDTVKEESPFLMMEEDEPSKVTRPFVLDFVEENNQEDDLSQEAIDEVTYDSEVIVETNIPLDGTKGFEFIQCEFIRTNGEQCKNQAPKGQTICSRHRKMLEKKGS